MPKALTDQRARERIVQDLDTTLLVEAGAGSGKTTSLAARMVELIQKGKAGMSGIAAITFTNKAASELRGRFRARLEAEIRKELPAEQIERIETALRQFSHIFIGTIHAFCGHLLRERPIEAGLDPDFEEMEEQADKEFRDRCWDDYLDRLRLLGQDEEIERLDQAGVDVNMLREVFHKVSAYADVDIYSEPADKPDFKQLLDAIRSFVQEALPLMPEGMHASRYDKMQEAVMHARQWLRSLDLNEDANILGIAKLFDRSLGMTLNRWRDADGARELRDRAFPDFRDRVIGPFWQQWREFLHFRLIGLVVPAVEACRRRRMEAGRLNFQDLLMKSVEMLREHADVRRYFSCRYTHLLVDEFQDTDPIQAEMMFLLTGSDPSIQNWKEMIPVPGSLFVVGDPKQSIYRFRRADISTYNFVKKRIQTCGAVLALTANFRSVRAIGDYVNFEFESKFVLPGQENDTQAEFVRMQTVRPNPKASGMKHGLYRITVPKMDRNKSADIAKYDAERVARAIAWSCRGNLQIAVHEDSGRVTTRPARPEDFLILLKRRTFIQLYAERLEQYGIPVEPAGSKAEFEELLALSGLVTALNDPGDPVPLLAVLRGLLFGVSDNALYHYRMEGGTFRLYALPETEGIFSETACPAYRAMRKLQDCMSLVRKLPAYSALLSIVENLGLLQAAAVRESGTLRSGTMVKLLELIRENAENNADWASIARYLQNLLEKSEVEGTGWFAGRGGAVRIMNLHKAKGLEAPVVFLACPCGRIDHDASEHVDRTSEPAKGYFTIAAEKAYQRDIIAQPKDWERLAEIERGYMRAEEERLLYVAATRARQLLIVSRYPDKPDRDPWRHLMTEEREWVNGDEMHRVEPEALRETSVSLEAFQAWREQAAFPAYAKTSVTGETKKAVPAPDRETKAGLTMADGMKGPDKDSTGVTEAPNAGKLHNSNGAKGMVFGTLVHRGIQAVGEGLPLRHLESFLRMAGEEEGIGSAVLPQAMEQINAVLKSDIWRRSLKAERRMHEYGFSVKIDAAPPHPETLLSGVIDYLFEEADGWVLVDFKTDGIKPGGLQDRIGYYRPQIRAYAEVWEQHFKRRVKEYGLFFLHAGYVKLN